MYDSFNIKHTLFQKMLMILKIVFFYFINNTFEKKIMSVISIYFFIDNLKVFYLVYKYLKFRSAEEQSIKIVCGIYFRVSQLYFTYLYALNTYLQILIRNMILKIKVTIQNN